eukprot:SAG31_NODE_1418_length_8439_cov_20.075540_7_plen_650_part_00
MSLNSTYCFLTALFFVYSTLALYCDRTLPSSDDGGRLPPYFFLQRSFWCASTVVDPLIDNDSDPTDIDELEGADEDVKIEAAAAKVRAREAINPEMAVEIRGLVMSFRSKGERCQSKIFHAVKAPWYSIRKNELFCLLGPNGAGKTTTINMLVGNLKPTAGSALELGHSIRSPAGMRVIRKRMGVCPQFDVQWKQLSAFEHLKLFGVLKGLGTNNETLQQQIIQRLHQVGLLHKEPWLAPNSSTTGWPVDLPSAHGSGMLVGTFSGGEKRRLSVAMALMAEPDLLYLDEPTTGASQTDRSPSSSCPHSILSRNHLFAPPSANSSTTFCSTPTSTVTIGMDPISRREVWNLIHETKKHPDRAVVLTTHSMEEAEILGDRVAIMAKGTLRCLGSTLRLKQVHGTGFVVKVTAQNSKRKTVLDIFEAIGVSSTRNGVNSSMQQPAQRPEPQTAPEVIEPNRVNIDHFNSELPNSRGSDSVPQDDSQLPPLHFVIPRAKEGAFRTAMAELRKLDGADVTLRLSTLESVFLKIERESEIFAASEDASKSQKFDVEVQDPQLDSVRSKPADKDPIPFVTVREGCCDCCCWQGNAIVTVDVGVEQKVVELLALGGAKRWFLLNIEWGHDEDGDLSVCDTQLRLASAEELVESGVGA